MLTLKWHIENEETSKKLAALEGIQEARLGRGCTIATVRGGEITIPDDIPMPDTVLVRAVEKGGGASNTGHCQVVCGIDGRPLEPLEGRCWGYALGDHAVFEAEALVIVSIARTRAGTTCSITNVSTKIEGRQIMLVGQELWRGPVSDLPHKYDCYGDALKAAIEKSKCYHCRHSHYYA